MVFSKALKRIGPDTLKPMPTRLCLKIKAPIRF